MDFNVLMKDMLLKSLVKDTIRHLPENVQVFLDKIDTQMKTFNDKDVIVSRPFMAINSYVDILNEALRLNDEAVIKINPEIKNVYEFKMKLVKLLQECIDIYFKEIGSK